MLGELNNDQIEEILSKEIVGRIGCHCNGRTYVVPISYAYDRQYIYAVSFEGLKLEIMRTNPRVCFQVDTMKDMINWQSVISWGNFEELKDKKETEKGLQILINRTCHYSQGLLPILALCDHLSIVI